MCITEDQVRKIVSEEVCKNNEKRDDNLFKFKEELFAHTSKILEHQKSSPGTTQELNNIKNNCFVRGTEMKQMNNRLNEIVEKQESQEKKLDTILEKLEIKFAAKWTERAMVAFISILVLAALYTIIEASGLKH